MEREKSYGFVSKLEVPAEGIGALAVVIGVLIESSMTIGLGALTFIGGHLVKQKKG